MHSSQSELKRQYLWISNETDSDQFTSSQSILQFSNRNSCVMSINRCSLLVRFPRLCLYRLDYAWRKKQKAQLSIETNVFVWKHRQEYIILDAECNDRKHRVHQHCQNIHFNKISIRNWMKWKRVCFAFYSQFIFSSQFINWKPFNCQFKFVSIFVLNFDDRILSIDLRIKYADTWYFQSFIELYRAEKSQVESFFSTRRTIAPSILFSKNLKPTTTCWYK